MVKFSKNKRGMAVLLSILGIAGASFIILLASMQAVISQKNTARTLWNRQQFNALLNPWVSQIMNDLQLAARYPEAVGLPAHPIKAANGAPCATKDAPTNGKYTLDAYLLPAGQACPLAIQPTQIGHDPYYNNYSANRKTYNYPKGLLTVDFFKNNAETSVPIVAETDPRVTLERLGSTTPQKYLYRVSVDFDVCDEPVAGRVVPSAEADRKNTIGVNWATPCPSRNLRRLSYSGIINADSPFFQEGTGFPPLNSGSIPSENCGDTSKPFDGTFESNLIGSMATSGGAVDLSEDLNTMITQTGTALTGNWNTSSTLNGTVSGTANGRTVTNASMTWAGGCTGTLVGTYTISDDGCLLTGNLSGSLSGSMTNPSDGSNIPCGAISVDIEGYKQ
ncbi:MAG: hypothetical protein EBQ92_03885 [Proteobacteria bacterium]|nr:hypothetical protein [Pseudomonadota bacterium]